MGVAGGLSAVSTGLSAFGSISEGQTKAANIRQQGEDKFLSSLYSSEQATLAAQVGDLKATQTDNYLRDQTQGQLANNYAELATTNTSDNSPTSWAVKNRFEQQADDTRTTATGNLRFQAQADRNAALLYMFSGYKAKQEAESNAQAAETSGFLGAAGGLLKGLSGISFG